jgi:hypothetical protein
MRLILVALAVVTCGVFAVDAFACSCAARPDAERFAEAQGAFVGTLVERRDLSQPGRPFISTGDPFVNVYRVDEVHKGSFGATVEIRTVRNDATCGLDHPVGTQIALYPRERDGAWHGGTCDVTTIEGMRAAAAAVAPKPPVVRRTAKSRRAKKKSRRVVRCAPRKARRRS